MSAKREAAVLGASEQIMSAFAESAKAAENIDFSPVPLGQRYPHQNPQHCPHSERSETEPIATEILGQPIAIQAVAELIGCSVWTVRQRLLPRGLPHFRIGRTGKLMFYRNQIVRWVLHQQRQRGGDIR